MTCRMIPSILAAVVLGVSVAGCGPAQTNEGARGTPDATTGVGGGRGRIHENVPILRLQQL